MSENKRCVSDGLTESVDVVIAGRGPDLEVLAVERRVSVVEAVVVRRGALWERVDGILAVEISMRKGSHRGRLVPRLGVGVGLDANGSR